MQPRGCGGESPQVWRSVDVYASPTANPVGAMQSEMEKGRLACRDPRVILQLLEHWNASLERSRARRAAHAAGTPRTSPAPARRIATAARRPRGARLRDLADEEPWQLSLGRSRARRRAAELHFVPTARGPSASRSARWRRSPSGPTASIASGQRHRVAAAGTEPATTTEHSIVLTEGSEGRQVQLLQQALGGLNVDGIFGPETEAAVRSFQSSHGLAVDGIVGPQTSAALRGGCAA